MYNLAMQSDSPRIDRIAIRWSWLLPPLAAGLYLGRLLSEFIAPSVLGAVAITAAATILLILLLRQCTFESGWPLLFLLLYVFYPDANLTAALNTAALTAIIGLLASYWRGQINFRKFGGMRLIGGVTLLIGFMALYLTTLSPGLLPADSGELQLVGAVFGVAHPPGFPLYTILANLFSRLPFNQSPAAMVNAFSAVTTVLTLLLVYLTIHRLTRSVAGSLLGALALGTSTTFWAQATTANVRSMTALFTALAIYLLVTYRQVEQTDSSQGAKVTSAAPPSNIMLTPTRKILLAFVLVMSIAVTHHSSLIFPGLIFIIFLLAGDRSWMKLPRMWLLVVLAALLGLLPLLYLPIRAAAGAVGAPSDLDTLRGFLNHVLALGFRGDFFYFTELGLLAERLKIMVEILAFQFDSLLLVAMGVGFLLLLWRDRKIAFLLGGVFLIMVLVTAMYRAPQSVEYLMPAYVPLAILLGYGLGWALRSLNSSGFSAGWSFGLGALTISVVGVTIAAIIAQGLDRLPSYSYLHQFDGTRDFTQLLIDNSTAGSIIMADWHWAMPLAYLQQVEEQGQDVEVEFINPTDEPYGQTWARRINEELEKDRVVMATHFDLETYADLPVPVPVSDAFLFGADPVNELNSDYQELDLILGGAIEIDGFALEQEPIEIGQEVIMSLAWKPVGPVEDLSLFAHIVGDADFLAAQQDIAAVATEEGYTISQFRLTPRPGTQPGKHSLMVGAYGTEPLLDGEGELRTAISSLEIISASTPAVTFNPTYKTLTTGDMERVLVGYDWDNTLTGQPRLYLHWIEDGGYISEIQDSPNGTISFEPFRGPWGIERSGQMLANTESQYYVPFGQGMVWSGDGFTDMVAEAGQELGLSQHFHSVRPIEHDLVISVRLVGFEQDGFHWDWWDLDDGIPAMGAIPTLKWIGGSAVRDPHFLTLSEDAAEGQVISPLLRIYDAFTGRENPILDERILQETSWVPLGEGIVQPR